MENSWSWNVFASIGPGSTWDLCACQNEVYPLALLVKDSAHPGRVCTAIIPLPTAPPEFFAVLGPTTGHFPWGLPTTQYRI